MGAADVLSRKTGVIVWVNLFACRQERILITYSGDDVQKLYKYCQEKNFAIPAINVTSSSTVVAALEAARDSKAPIILQVSQGGAVSLIAQWPRWYISMLICDRLSLLAKVLM